MHRKHRSQHKDRMLDENTYLEVQLLEPVPGHERSPLPMLPPQVGREVHAAGAKSVPRRSTSNEEAIH